MYGHYAYSWQCRVSYQRELLNIESLSVKYVLHVGGVAELAL